MTVLYTFTFLLNFILKRTSRPV